MDINESNKYYHIVLADLRVSAYRERIPTTARQVLETTPESRRVAATPISRGVDVLSLNGGFSKQPHPARYHSALMRGRLQAMMSAISTSNQAHLQNSLRAHACNSRPEQAWSCHTCTAAVAATAAPVGRGPGTCGPIPRLVSDDLALPSQQLCRQYGTATASCVAAPPESAAKHAAHAMSPASGSMSIKVTHVHVLEASCTCPRDPLRASEGEDSMVTAVSDKEQNAYAAPKNDIYSHMVHDLAQRQVQQQEER